MAVDPKYTDRNPRFVLGTLGKANAAAYYGSKFGLVRTVASSTGERLVRLRDPKVASPLYCRYNHSDLLTYSQVFHHRQYGCLDGVKDVRYIVDAGANVGYTSAYFLSVHPEAQLVALEPDTSNAAVARKNVEAFGERAQVLGVGLWNRTARLTVEREGLAANAFQVREAKPGEAGDVDAVDIPSLMDRFGWARIDILKVDIERSERFVFQASAERWLPAIRHIAIELHDDECRRVFFQTVEPYCSEITEAGELTICRMKRS